MAESKESEQRWRSEIRVRAFRAEVTLHPVPWSLMLEILACRSIPWQKKTCSPGAHIPPVLLCAKSLQSGLPLQPHGLQPTRLLCPWDSPGKNTGVGCHALLQGVSSTQGWKPYLLCLLRWQAASWRLAPPGSPPIPPGRQINKPTKLTPLCQVMILQSAWEDETGWRPKVTKLRLSDYLERMAGEASRMRWHLRGRRPSFLAEEQQG